MVGAQWDRVKTQDKDVGRCVEGSGPVAVAISLALIVKYKESSGLDTFACHLRNAKYATNSPLALELCHIYSSYIRESVFIGCWGQ